MAIAVIITTTATFAILSLLWFLTIIEGKLVFIITGIVIFICAIIQAIVYIIDIGSTKIQETDFPKFTFYYKDFDCEYKEVKSKVDKEFVKADKNMLKSQPVTNYMEIYCDRNFSVKEKSKGNTVAGFALRSYAEKDIGISKVLEALKYKKKEFKECKAVIGSMNMTDDVVKRVALNNLMKKTWNYVVDEKKTQGIPFMLEDKKKVICGVFIGEESNQFKVLRLEDASAVESEILSSGYDKKNK